MNDFAKSLLLSCALASLTLLGCGDDDETPTPMTDLGVARDLGGGTDAGTDGAIAIDMGARVDAARFDAAPFDAGPLTTPEMVDCAGATIAQTVHATVAAGFVADDITVAPGAVVQWINDDTDMDHTVWGAGPGGEASFAFSLSIGQTLCARFFSVSDYEYACYFHPSMTGTVRVR